MNIAIFINNTPEDVGGGYTFELELVREIERNGIGDKHKVIAFGWQAENASDSQQLKNIRYVSLVMPKKGGFRSAYESIRDRLFRAIFKNKARRNARIRKQAHIRRTLEENKIDIVWALNPFFMPVSDYPYIYTVWDLQHRLQPYFPEVSIDDEWGRRENYYSEKVRKASIVVTGTEAGKEEIHSFYQIPRDRIRVIGFPAPQEVEVSDDAGNIKEKYNLPDEFLFYPAQYWPHKNHAGLLFAIKNLKDRWGLNVPVVFSGSDKGNEAYIDSLVRKLNLENLVYKIGFIPRQDVDQLYKNCLALTFVSYFGPDNLPPIEALAFGCPVVAAKVPGAEEQLGDAVILVDPGSENEIADAIKKLIDDQEFRDELVRRGYKNIEHKTAQTYIKAIGGIIDELEPIRRCWDNSSWPASD
jgi:glycosyltransferase involved in cell wall biosynthesis